MPQAGRLASPTGWLRRCTSRAAIENSILTVTAARAASLTRLGSTSVSSERDSGPLAMRVAGGRAALSAISRVQGEGARGGGGLGVHGGEG